MIGSRENFHPYLLSRADRVFQELESGIPSFPDSCCTFSSKVFVGGVVTRVYLAFKFGVRAVEGGFKLDSPDNGRLEIDHNWLVDKQGNYLDLTAHQFNPWLDVPLPAEVQIIKPGDPLRDRYVFDQSYHLLHPRSVV